MKRSRLTRKTPLKRTRISTKKPMLKRTKLNPVSKNEKKRKERKLYKSLRQEYLEEHPYCECGTEADPCKEEATDIHHKAGRASFLNRVDTWMAACRECHEWLHRNPKESYEKGHLINAAALLKREQEQKYE